VLIRVIQQSSFTHAVIHANFTGHTTTSSPLPSPPTHDSLSLHHRHIQGSHLHSICHLFLGLLLLISYEKVDGDIISTVFLGSIQNCSQTHRSTGHCTCIFSYSSHYLTLYWSLRSADTQDQDHHNVNSLPTRWMPISIVIKHKQVTTPAQQWLDSKLATMTMVTVSVWVLTYSLTLQESWHLPPPFLSRGRLSWIWPARLLLPAFFSSPSQHCLPTPHFTHI